MFGLGFGEIIIILFIALLFIGPKKLPELARSLGKGLREFKKATSEMSEQITQSDSNETPKAQTDSAPESKS